MPRALAGPVTAYLAMVVGMALCMAEFPDHLAAVAGAFVFAHAAASMAVAAVRQEMNMLQDVVRHSELTKRIGIDELARRMARGEASSLHVDAPHIWKAASEEAREELDGLAAGAEAGTQEPALLPAIIAHFALLALYYGFAVALAATMAKLPKLL